MTVFSDSQEEEVVPVTCFGEATCNRMELSLAKCGGIGRRQFALDAKYIALRNKDF